VQSIQKHLEAPSHHSEPPRITLEHSESLLHHPDSFRTNQNHLETPSESSRIHSDPTRNRFESPSHHMESPGNHVGTLRMHSTPLSLTHAHSRVASKSPRMRLDTQNHPRSLRIHSRPTLGNSEYTQNPPKIHSLTTHFGTHSECNPLRMLNSGTHNPTVT
jgi:hypothetical protein